jgi:hypothetical protein
MDDGRAVGGAKGVSTGTGEVAQTARLDHTNDQADARPVWIEA